MDSTLDPSHPEWGPFGRPLFDDPLSQALSRVGVIDIGSNSVRLVVFDGAARSPAYFYNEKIMCGLGAGMSETGRLNPEGKIRAFGAIRRFQMLAEGMNLPPLTAVATAAMREAEDGPAFREEVEAATGLRIWVIDGEEEARLSAQGVLLGWPGSYGLTCDVGGSSMELAEIFEGRVGRRVSSALGPLKLRDLPGGKKGRDAVIKESIEELSQIMGTQRDRLFLVGGSWRAIARIDMHRQNYPLHVLHEYRMTAKTVQATVKYIEKADLEALRSECSLSSARMSLVPYAAEVLRRLVQVFKPKDIAISSYGIREGLLYEQMPQQLRDRDPLIEACRFAEAKDARLPGFGKKLYKFVLPIYPQQPGSAAAPRQGRLSAARCELAGPPRLPRRDLFRQCDPRQPRRAQPPRTGVPRASPCCIGTATSAKAHGSRISMICSTTRDKQDAEILGKAMRFGAMLWMSDTSQDGASLEWQPKNKVLRLILTKQAQPLFGEVAESRFGSLARSMGARSETKII